MFAKPLVLDLDEAPSDPFTVALAMRDADVPLLVEQALLAGRTHLALQPVAAASGGVSFHEALIRLSDAQGRILPAGAFLPEVEESELGRRLDVASLSLGLRLLAARPGLRLSINMSARSIGYAPWRDRLAAWCAAHPGAAARLIFEITETSAMQLPEVTVGFMEEMQPQGTAFALDGFGSGAIAFHTLKDFLFDLAKIDIRYGAGIDGRSDHRAIVSALIAVAKQFEMFTVAQGIEREAEAASFRDLGVDCLQGFRIGRPTRVG